MNEKAITLVWQMILATMAGRRKRTWDLYEQYAKEKWLHVSIKEILEAKAEERIA